MKTYRGVRGSHKIEVTVDRHPLDLRLDLYCHSLDGFAWGCGNNGAAQLALAILADHLADDEQALLLHQYFKWDVILSLPRQRWQLTERDIDRRLQVIMHEHKITFKTSQM